MLFALEQGFWELDLDGERVLRDEHSYPVAELVWELQRATERVAEMVDEMKSAVIKAGCGDRPAAAAAQQAAVARWLSATDENLIRMEIEVGHLARLCH